MDVEPPQEDDDEPSYGLLDGPGPLASIFEDDETEERAERGRSRSPPPTVAARSRRTSVLEPDAERTPVEGRVATNCWMIFLHPFVQPSNNAESKKKPT